MGVGGKIWFSALLGQSEANRVGIKHDFSKNIIFGFGKTRILVKNSHP